jgi:hypothetical protein
LFSDFDLPFFDDFVYAFAGVLPWPGPLLVPCWPELSGVLFEDCEFEDDEDG